MNLTDPVFTGQDAARAYPLGEWHFLPAFWRHREAQEEGQERAALPTR